MLNEKNFYCILGSLCAGYFPKYTDNFLPLIKNGYLFSMDKYLSIKRRESGYKCEICNMFLKTEFMHKFKLSLDGIDNINPKVCLGCENPKEYNIYIHNNKKLFYKTPRDTVTRNFYICEVNMKNCLVYVQQYIKHNVKTKEQSINILQYIAIFVHLDLPRAFVYKILTPLIDILENETFYGVPNNNWWAKEFEEEISLGLKVINSYFRIVKDRRMEISISGIKVAKQVCFFISIMDEKYLVV